MNIVVPSSLKEKAREVLLKNREATGGKYVCPSWPHYPHQWLWDSSFHAIALAALGFSSFAKEEIRRLFVFQRNDGFIPHIQYIEKRLRSVKEIERFLYPDWRLHSAHTQPPVLARAVKSINESLFTKEIFEKVKNFYLYFIRFQDPDNDGLISNFLSTETGRDATPEFDRFYPRIKGWGPIGRIISTWFYFGRLFWSEWRYQMMGWNIARIGKESPLDVEDLMFNCVWVDGMYILAELESDAAGKQELIRLARRTEEAVIQKCWDEKNKTFRCLAKDNSFIETLTVSNLFPLLLPNLPREYAEAIFAQLTDPKKFWAPYPVPSVAVSDPAFDPDRKEHLLWRGPTWVNTNWYLVIGLLRHGFREQAEELALRTIAMVEREGFREFYQPFTGKGMRVHNFGWSTLAAVIDEPF